MEIESEDDVVNDNGSADIVGFAAERCCATDGNYRKMQLKLLLPWICLLVVVRLFTALRLALLSSRHDCWHWRIGHHKDDYSR